MKSNQPNEPCHSSIPVPSVSCLSVHTSSVDTPAPMPIMFCIAVFAPATLHTSLAAATSPCENRPVAFRFPTAAHLPGARRDPKACGGAANADGGARWPAPAADEALHKDAAAATAEGAQSHWPACTGASRHAHGRRLCEPARGSSPSITAYRARRMCMARIPDSRDDSRDEATTSDHCVPSPLYLVAHEPKSDRFWLCRGPRLWSWHSLLCTAW